MREKYYSASQLSTNHRYCSALSTPAQRCCSPAGICFSPFTLWILELSKLLETGLKIVYPTCNFIIIHNFNFFLTTKVQKTLVLITGLRLQSLCQQTEGKGCRFICHSSQGYLIYKIRVVGPSFTPGLFSISR